MQSTTMSYTSKQQQNKSSTVKIQPDLNTELTDMGKIEVENI